MGLKFLTLHWPNLLLRNHLTNIVAWKAPPPPFYFYFFFKLRCVCVGRGSRGRYIKEVVSTDAADRVSLLSVIMRLCLGVITCSLRASGGLLSFLAALN